MTLRELIEALAIALVMALPITLRQFVALRASMVFDNTTGA